MYAIVDINGKQYKVEEGNFVEVDLLGKEAGEAVTLDRVLLVSDGKKATIGKPTVEGASVTAKVLGETKSKKVVVYKMKPKKGYRRKQGHRQQYTKLQIEKIAA
ncbi:MAG: 50S ribosomal protein L21 [Candidatus Melainabacteria bacterium]|nr:50S ribosomal protein L21 [Candidatus Melainabacteria bacterium]